MEEFHHSFFIFDDQEIHKAPQEARDFAPNGISRCTMVGEKCEYSMKNAYGTGSNLKKN